MYVACFKQHKVLDCTKISYFSTALSMAANFYCTKDSGCPNCTAPAHHFCHHGECHCHMAFECDEDSECTCPKGTVPHCDAPHCHCHICKYTSL